MCGSFVNGIVYQLFPPQGRKPKVKRGPKPKDRSKSPLVSESVRFKKESSVDSFDLPSSGDISSSSTTASVLSPCLSPLSSSSQQDTHELRRRRSQLVSPPNVRKRPRKSSVQSLTLSVTRILVPVHTDTAIPEEESSRVSESETSRAGPPPSSPKPSSPPVLSINSAPPRMPERKPRSLRVSLNLPDEVEPGSPIEKMKKSQQKLHSPKVVALSLPLWDDDLGPKPANPQMKSPPLSGGKIINLVSQRQSPAESRSPTPKSDDTLLTPFTASALPLQATPTSLETGERQKRRREEEKEGDTVEDSLVPKRAKPSLKSPPSSPLDDVFTSPVPAEEAELIPAQQPTLQPHITDDSPTHTPSIEQPETKTEAKSKIVSMESTFLPPSATPVGYGAKPQEVTHKQATPAQDTPSVQPFPADKVSSPSDLAPPSVTHKQATTVAIQAVERVVVAHSPTVIRPPPRQDTTISQPKPTHPSPTESKPKSKAVQNRPNVCSASSRLPTSGRTAVSVITTSPTASGGVVKPLPTPKQTDSDIVITSVEIRPPPSSTSKSGLQPTTDGGTPNSATTSKPTHTATHVAPGKAHHQSLSEKNKSGTRITAKITVSELALSGLNFLHS